MEGLDLQIIHQLGNSTRTFYPTVNIEPFIVCQRNHSQLFFVLLNHMKSFTIILAGHKSLQKFNFKLRYHFGGGGTSRIRTSIQFAIAEGTVYLYTHRVTVALLSLQQEYINWPAPHSLAEYQKLWNDIISCMAFPIALDSLMELPYHYIVNQSRMESGITPERVITDTIQQLLLIVQLKFYL
jgi:hypothetical protein